jgi:hypothetical protein
MARKYSEYERGAGYSFETWMEFADAVIMIPDMPWYEWYYNAKLTPLGAVKKAMATMRNPRTAWW